MNPHEETNAERSASDHWYLVANHFEAVIYRGRPERSPSVVQRIFNSEASRHPSLRDESSRFFAHRLSRILLLAAQQGKVHGLTIFAEPHFLELLKKSFPKHEEGNLRTEFHSTINGSSDERIHEVIEERKKLA